MFIGLVTFPGSGNTIARNVLHRPVMANPAP
jgi:hypothetical protein